LGISRGRSEFGLRQFHSWNFSELQRDLRSAVNNETFDDIEGYRDIRLLPGLQRCHRLKTGAHHLRETGSRRQGQLRHQKDSEDELHECDSPVGLVVSDMTTNTTMKARTG